MTPANIAVALTLLLLTQSLCVSTGFICPDISYLDSFVQLICTGGSDGHRYTNPSGGVVARCFLIEGRPCQPESASASVINSTQSVFNISGVQTTDAGTWSCENAIPKFETCNLTVAKTPTCSITSKEDTDVLTQYQALTLTVDIQDYYCSTAITFSLQTGNVTTLLMEADSVTSVTHNTSSVTLNVTASNLGVVGLIFSCHNSQRNLTCDGVTELKTKTSAVPGNVELASDTTIIIAACVVGAIVFLIIVVIVFLVKRKQVTRKKPQPSVKPPSPPFPTVELNLTIGSKNINVIPAGGYACPWDVVNNAETSSRMEDESHDLSLVYNGTVDKVFDSSCKIHA